jgi:hypothetical protein
MPLKFVLLLLAGWAFICSVLFCLAKQRQKIYWSEGDRPHILLHNTSFWWLPFGQSNTACSAALNKRSGVLCFIRNRRAATVSPRPQVPLIIFPGRTALRPTIRDEQHATPSACSEAWRCLPARAQTAGAMGTSASRAAGWLDPHPPRERRRISPQTRPISPTRPPVRRPRATRGRLPRRAARAHVSRTAWPFDFGPGPTRQVECSPHWIRRRPSCRVPI